MSEEVSKCLPDESVYRPERVTLDLAPFEKQSDDVYTIRICKHDILETVENPCFNHGKGDFQCSYFESVQLTLKENAAITFYKNGVNEGRMLTPRYINKLPRASSLANL